MKAVSWVRIAANQIVDGQIPVSAEVANTVKGLIKKHVESLNKKYGGEFKFIEFLENGDLVDEGPKESTKVYLLFDNATEVEGNTHWAAF